MKCVGRSSTEVIQMPSIRSGRLLSCLVLGFAMLATPPASFAQVRVSIGIAPPMLPVYDQPLCPGDGYIWTPGYWARGYDDYYWVPGTWVLAPQVGWLWTPGYWGWGDGGYLWNEGWWGPQVGFYGGVDYGYGYNGFGYDGGYWSGGHFFYNTRVNHIDVGIIRNTYSKPVQSRGTRISYNGGRGGISARPTRQQETFNRANHAPPTGDQSRHVQDAIRNPSQRFSANHGAPPVAATPRPAAFSDRGVVPARPTAAGRGAERRQATPPSRANPPRTEARPANPPSRANPPRTEGRQATPPSRANPAPPRAQPQPRNAPQREGKAPTRERKPRD